VRIIGYRPGNRWVRRPLDPGLWLWLTRCCLAALVVAAVLAAFVGPSQSTVRSRYQIAQLTQEVEHLEREHRALLVERERRSSPVVLTEQLAELGLVRVAPQQVAYLDASGRLLRALASATPTPPVPLRPGRERP
jgi:hypothetical protein